MPKRGKPYSSCLVFKNEGTFIPETIEATLESGYKPPYYRNPLLPSAMNRTGMMDRLRLAARDRAGGQLWRQNKLSR